MIWKQEFTIEALNSLSANTILEQIGIEFTEYGEDYLTARMPVDHRTVQPMRLLHGGASVVLAESLGSTASVLCSDDPNKSVVGVEINANHLRSVTSGFVYGTVRPIKIGRTIQVWQTEIRDENGKLACISRLTCTVVNR